MGGNRLGMSKAGGDARSERQYLFREGFQTTRGCLGVLLAEEASSAWENSY